MTVTHANKLNTKEVWQFSTQNQRVCSDVVHILPLLHLNKYRQIVTLFLSFTLYCSCGM